MGSVAARVLELVGGEGVGSRGVVGCGLNRVAVDVSERVIWVAGVRQARSVVLSITDLG